MNTISVTSLKKQRGVSKFGLLMMFILIAGFFTIGLKVGPLYIDHNLISGICQELIDNGEAANMSVREVRERVANSLRINNVTGFDLSDITMRRESGQTILSINYERQVPLFANLEIVAIFDTELR